MPRSFLVRLRPSAENSSCYNSNSNGPKKSYESIELSEETIPNQPITIVPTNDAFSTQRSHPKSHIIVMSSSDSQSNSTMAMTSYQSNQSAISTRVHHGMRSSLELTTPVPKYQHIMPRIPSWTSQCDYLPSNNNSWYYPPLSSEYMQLQKFPRKDETLLHTGGASHRWPVCAEDNTMIRTQQCHQMPQNHSENKRQRVSDRSTVQTAFKEIFSIDKILGTRHPDEKTNAATAAELLQPTDQSRFENHAQNPFEHASRKPDLSDENSGNVSQKDEPSGRSNKDGSPSPMSRGTPPLGNPENLKSHQSSSEKIHACAQCNKSFNRVSNLRAHMKTHSEHRPYKCDYCGKGFHQKIDKRIHHYTHTGEKPHKCKKCGRGFKQLTHLNYHMRTHSDTHMYHCTYCGKGFNQKGNLQAHIYGHTGQRPFKCEICSKGFTLRSTLNTHLRTHAPKKPFVCEHCNKAFYQKNALKMHHIASHPIINGKSIL